MEQPAPSPVSTTANLPEGDPQSVAVAPAKPGASTTHLSREQILRVTAECLLEHGYDATTIRQIAGMLRCAVGSIYRYFPDKRSLLYAVTQQILQPVADMVAPEDGQAPAQGVLDQSVELYAQRAAAAPEVYRLMFWLASVGQTNPTAQSLPDVILRILAGWGRLLGSAELAKRRWALVHGGLMLGLDEQRITPFIHAALAVPDGLSRTTTAAQLPPQPAPIDSAKA